MYRDMKDVGAGSGAESVLGEARYIHNSGN